jgi:hypothetical protein
MNLKTLIAAAALSAATVSQAATGFFGNLYIVAGATNTFYQAAGTPDGFNPALASFGTFNVGDTFNIRGFELNTFEDNGSVITHMTMNWSIDNFVTTNQIQITPAPPKSGNDRFWQVTTASQNLLTNNTVTSIGPGSYTFQAYFEGFTNGFNTPGNIFLSNGGNNYDATFNVIPEPSTYAALAGVVAVCTALVLRRRRS